MTKKTRFWEHPHVIILRWILFIPTGIASIRFLEFISLQVYMRLNLVSSSGLFLFFSYGTFLTAIFPGLFLIGRNIGKMIPNPKKRGIYLMTVVIILFGIINIIVDLSYPISWIEMPKVGYIIYKSVSILLFISGLWSINKENRENSQDKDEIDEGESNYYDFDENDEDDYQEYEFDEEDYNDYDFDEEDNNESDLGISEEQILQEKQDGKNVAKILKLVRLAKEWKAKQEKEKGNAEEQDKGVFTARGLNYNEFMTYNIKDTFNLLVYSVETKLATEFVETCLELGMIQKEFMDNTWLSPNFPAFDNGYTFHYNIGHDEFTVLEIYEKEEKILQAGIQVFYKPVIFFRDSKKHFKQAVGFLSEYYGEGHPVEFDNVKTIYYQDLNTICYISTARENNKDVLTLKVGKAEYWTEQ